MAARVAGGGSLRAAPARRAAGARRVTAAPRLRAAAEKAVPAPSAAIDWDTIGFGLTETKEMFVATCPLGGEWEAGSMQPYGPLALSPSSQVLNYGQGAFEGMKAYRSVEGRIVLFRPEENAARLRESAARMSMPGVPDDVFLRGVMDTVRANAEFVPPLGMGSLYLRPLLIGSGPILGLGPAPEYTFMVYCSPVGAYFKGGQLTPIDLLVEEEFHRAAPGGTGSAKAVGNYSPVLVSQLAAKKEGYSDVIYLDAVENKYIEEVSSCNMFVVKGKSIATPALGGTILPGITRKSVIQLARDRGFEVEERPVSIEEAMAADEVFCTGTAVVVVPVGSITYKGEKKQYCGGEVSPVAQELYTALTDLQQEKAPDERGWVVEVDC